MTHIRLVQLILCLLPLSVFASNLSLSDCYRDALQYNAQRSVLIEKSNELDSKIDEISGQILPSLSANGIVTHNGVITEAKFGNQIIKFSPDNSYRFGFQASQLIFDGKRVSNTIELQRINRTRSTSDRDKIEQDLAYSVTTSYWNWVLSRKVEGVARKSKESSFDNANLAQKRFEAGQISKFDLLRAQVQADQFLTNWESAKANRSRAIRMLSYLTGRSINDSDEPSDSLQYRLTDYSLDSLMSVAIQKRIEFTQLKQMKSLTEIGIKLSKVGYYPMVNGTANLIWANGQDMFHPNDLKQNWTIGIQLNYPIFDGHQTRARVQQSKSQLKQVDWQASDIERIVSNEMKLALIALDDAERRLRLQDRYVTQAEEAYQLARNEFVGGQTSSRDVADAELALSTARMSREQALYDWTIALASVKKATGELRFELQERIEK